MKAFFTLFVFSFLIMACSNQSKKNVYQNNSHINKVFELNDDDIVLRTRTALYKADNDFALINVYSVYNKIFLIGEISDIEKQRKATTIAKKYTKKGVLSKWFNENTSTLNDEYLEYEIIAKLNDIDENITIKSIGGNVILIGILNDGRNMNKVVNTVKKVNGVKTTTNFLTLTKYKKRK